MTVKNAALRRKGPLAAVLGAVMLLSAAPALADDCKRPTGLEGSSPHIINFETDSSAVPAEEREWLKDQAERYAEHPSLEVCVIGQADKTGDPAYNRKLSMKRAENVAAILKKHGLKDKTFQVIGRGEAFGDTGGLLEDLLGDTKAERRVEVIFYR